MGILSLLQCSPSLPLIAVMMQWASGKDESKRITSKGKHEQREGKKRMDAWISPPLSFSCEQYFFSTRVSQTFWRAAMLQLIKLSLYICCLRRCYLWHSWKLMFGCCGFATGTEAFPARMQIAEAPDFLAGCGSILYVKLMELMFSPSDGLACGWWLSLQKRKSSWRGQKDLELWPEMPHWKSWLRCMDLDAQHVPQPHHPCKFIWGYILPPYAAWNCGLALTPYPQHSLLPGGEQGWEALACGVKQAACQSGAA